MPSPTSSTRPTSRVSMALLYWSISVWRTETISSALNLITASFDQLVADGFELRAHRGVVEPVADADVQAGGQFGGHAGLQQGLEPERVAELVRQPLPLVVGQGHGRDDLHRPAVGPAVAQLTEGGGDQPQQTEPVVVVEDVQEVEKGFTGATLEDLFEGRRLLLPAHRSGGQEGFEIRAGVEQVADERVQLLGNGVGPAALLSRVQKRLGIRPGDTVGADVRAVVGGGELAVVVHTRRPPAWRCHSLPR